MKKNIEEMKDFLNHLKEFSDACRNSEYVCRDILELIHKLKSTKTGVQQAELVREIHEQLQMLNWEYMGNMFGATYDQELETLGELAVTAIGEPKPEN